MFSPAAASSQMAPGDKVSMTFHKAKAEPGGGFVDQARQAGLIPGHGGAAPAPAAHMPQMQAVSHPAVPDHRAMLAAALRRHMMMAR